MSVLSNVQKVINDVSPVAYDAGLNAAAATLGGYLYSLNLANSAIFGAVQYLVSKVVEPIFDKLFAGTNKETRFFGNAFTVAASVAITAGLANLAGIPVTLGSAVVYGVSALALKTFVKPSVDTPSVSFGLIVKA